MKLSHTFGRVCVLAGVLTGTRAFGVPIDITRIYDIGNGAYTTAAGINDAGNVAGYYFDGTGQHGFTDIGGILQTGLNYPGGTSTAFTSINNSNEVVGRYLTGSSSGGALFYFNGVFSDMPLGGVLGPIPYGINSQGQIAGSYRVSSTSIVGFVAASGQSTPTAITLPGQTDPAVVGINDAGEFAGTVFNSGRGRGFIGSLSNPGVYAFVDVPGSFITHAEGIDPYGNVVGRYTDSDPNLPNWGGFHGFLYADGTFTTLDIPGAYSVNVYGRNASGILVGEYNDANGIHGYTGTVDEPGPLWLFALGVTLVLITRWHAKASPMPPNLSMLSAP